MNSTDKIYYAYGGSTISNILETTFIPKINESSIKITLSASISSRALWNPNFISISKNNVIINTYSYHDFSYNAPTTILAIDKISSFDSINYSISLKCSDKFFSAIIINPNKNDKAIFLFEEI